MKKKKFLQSIEDIMEFWCEANNDTVKRVAAIEKHLEIKTEALNIMIDGRNEYIHKLESKVKELQTTINGLKEDNDALNLALGTVDSGEALRFATERIRYLENMVLTGDEGYHALEERYQEALDKIDELKAEVKRWMDITVRNNNEHERKVQTKKKS
jgi:hypothetical protein